MHEKATPEEGREEMWQPQEAIPWCLSCLAAPTNRQGSATQEVLEGGLRNTREGERQLKMQTGVHKPPL